MQAGERNVSSMVRPGIGMEVEATAEHPAEHRLGHFGEEIRIHDKPAEKIRGL